MDEGQVLTLGSDVPTATWFGSVLPGFAWDGSPAFWRGAGRRPGVLGCDAAFDDAGAFGFEEASLEAGKGLADDDTSAGGNDAVPGDGLTARASGHGSAGGTSAAREAHSQGQLAVGGNASFGDALNEGVESLPGGVHVGKDSRYGRNLLDTRASEFSGENFRG